MVRMLVGMVIAIAAASWACRGSDDSDRSYEVVRRDSAGVEIVTNLVDVGLLPVVGVAEDSELVIDSEESDSVILHWVSTAFWLPDGRIVVASRGSYRVYVFGADGSLLRSLGGEGEGPGELQAVQSVIPRGPDSLTVYDPNLRRMTVFALDGSVGRTVDLSYLAPRRGWSRMHGLPDGYVLVGEAGLARQAGPGPYREEAPSYRLTIEGDSVGSYGQFPGLESVQAEGLMGPLPFGAMLQSGTRGDRLVIGTAEGPEIAEYGLDGRPVRLIRWPDLDRRVDEEDMADFVESNVAALPDEQREAMRERVAGLPHAPRRPAYHGLVVTDDGEVWVGDYPGAAEVLSQEAGPERHWLVIDAVGVTRRVIRTPAGFVPMSVREGRILGVHTDELGVETIRVLLLEAG